ncbi:MAG TPA: hypothetical protein VK828_20145 [Terriglobales bacterium]|nr:hypothetical protein [Terriglobales bacterium]
MPKVLIVVAIACFVIASGCTAPSVRSSLRQNAMAPGQAPKLLAVYMPWFGDHTHIDVGYSSQDPGVLKQQIQQARKRGISAFVVDWYGESRPYSDHNFGVLQEVAIENHFQVALLYNEPEDEDAQATDAAMNAFDEAYKSYIGPEARFRDAYLTYNGRPMIFIFPKRGHVDWNRVREHSSGWEAAPLIFYKDEPPPQYSADFAGSFAWVQPGRAGWIADGSNWGEEYLDNFYKAMSKRPDKITIGAAWPGFDDSKAKWGLNRHMQSSCGKTLDETMSLYRRYFDDANPLPFVMIETWNDYEEGTAIERQTAGCGANQPQG